MNVIAEFCGVDVQCPLDRPVTVTWGADSEGDFMGTGALQAAIGALTVASADVVMSSSAHVHNKPMTTTTTTTTSGEPVGVEFAKGTRSCRTYELRLLLLQHTRINGHTVE